MKKFSIFHLGFEGNENADMLAKIEDVKENHYSTINAECQRMSLRQQRKKDYRKHQRC